jgi:hypothetical protein
VITITQALHRKDVWMTILVHRRLITGEVVVLAAHLPVVPTIQEVPVVLVNVAGDDFTVINKIGNIGIFSVHHQKMELPSVGENCADCNSRDFLPFKCQNCSAYFW